MKRETRRILERQRRAGQWAHIGPGDMESILATDAEVLALRAEMKRKDAALMEAVDEFKRRGESPWGACAACEAALRPLRKGKQS